MLTEQTRGIGEGDNAIICPEPPQASSGHESYGFLTIAELGNVRIVHERVGSMCSYRISNVDDCLLLFGI